MGACGVLIRHKMGVLMGAHGEQAQCWVPGVLQGVLVGC